MIQRYAIGIDVGGSSLKCGLVNQQGKMLYSFLMPLEDMDSGTDISTFINAAIRKCIARTSAGIVGIGIGFPGIVTNNVVIGGANNLPTIKNFELGNIIAESTGMPVIVDNDANMMAYGEKYFGAARNATDIVFLTVGTGIGGCLILNNEVYSGYENRGAELGHVIVHFNGRQCTCGAKGCLEEYASTRALLQDYFTYSGKKVEGKEIVAAYHRQEETAVRTFSAHFDYLAVGIAGFINIFSPQKLVIGGGISEAGSFYINEIKSRVAKIAMPDAILNTEILAASLGNHAGVLGSAARAFYNFNDNI